MPAVLDEHLHTRVARTALSTHLFPSLTGGVWTSTDLRARSRWIEATRRAGDETTSQNLRHTAASLLVAAGAELQAVHVILGH